MSADDEHGSVTTWMATASFAMITLVGLAVDLGGQVHAQQRAHDLAAQAARAGGESVQAAPAIQGDYARIDVPAARQAAKDYLDAANVTGTVRVRGEVITVQVSDTYDTRFLDLVGIDDVRVHGSARAHLLRTLGDTVR